MCVALPGFPRGRCLFDQLRGPVRFLDQVIQGTDLLLHSFRLVFQFGDAEIRRGRVFCVFSQPDQVFVKLNEIFQDVFDDEDINVNDATTAADVDGWDSLEHINLLVAIERGFDIRFTMGETTGLKNVGEMVDKIMAHLG